MKFEYCKSIRIPMPPSANRMWRIANLQQDRYAMMTSKSKMIATDAYLTWQKEFALAAVGCERWKIEEKAYVVAIEAGPFSGKRDLDNICKPIIDMLHKTGLTPDDRYLKCLFASRYSFIIRELLEDKIDFRKRPQAGDVDVYFAAAPKIGN